MRACVAVVVLVGFWSCGGSSEDQPPAVRLGDSVCAHCDMIISDGRFGTATMIAGQRGPEPLLFDDFNCQAIYEAEHPEVKVLRRWSRDFRTQQWSPTELMHFVFGPKLQTPMASFTAAFQDRDQARQLATAVEGQVFEFAEIWDLLSAHSDDLDRLSEQGRNHPKDGSKK